MTTAHEFIASCSALLLDFDGPMAALMPPPLNAQAAERVRRAAAVVLPDELRTTADHLAILRHLLDQPDALERAEAEATAAEIDCARTCQSAPWLADLLTAAHARGIPWAVVTNNSPDAVHAFLSRFDYPPPAAVAGRTLATTDRLKPDPLFLTQAMTVLGVNPAATVFVGDSVTDIEAGRVSGVRVIGYANTTARELDLLSSGAETCIRSRVWRFMPYGGGEEGLE